MRMHLLIGACAASCLAVTASGATPLFAANPTRLDPDPNSNDAGLLGIKHDTGMHVDGAGGDQGLKGSYSMVNDSDLGGAIDSGGLTTITRGLGIYDTGGAGGFVQKPDDFLGTDSSKLTSIAAAGTDQNPDSNGAAPS